MPRDLTDLMERATTAPPPEPHDAATITHLAARQQRRRTTSIVAGLAVGLVAAGTLGYGVSRHDDTQPEPVGRFKYDQTVDLSSAVPASTLPGYHAVPWTVPSVQHFGSSSDKSPLPTYADIDAQGRLVVEDLPNGHGPGEHPSGHYRARIYARPKQAPLPVQAPPSVPAGQHRWMPSFLDDGRLLWMNGEPVGRSGFHVTDLDGGRDFFVKNSPAAPGMGNGVAGWVAGDHYWYTVVDDVQMKSSYPVIKHSLYRATFSGD
ncbi:MAG TPA: hypothetical protein VH228_14720, partial [Nocardioides sp.]|nr:hypothetical protein [Nocardioides sp.]